VSVQDFFHVSLGKRDEFKPRPRAARPPHPAPCSSPIARMPPATTPSSPPPSLSRMTICGSRGDSLSLGPFLDRLPRELLEEKILKALPTTALTLFGRTCRGAREMMIESGDRYHGDGRSRPEGCPTCGKFSVYDFVTSVPLLAWALSNGLKVDATICSNAAFHGALDVLAFARENGIPWDLDTCDGAAQGAKLDVLQWVIERGCPLETSACEVAAEVGHLDVLKFLRARDPPCPWGPRVAAGAAANGNLECLKWLHENGCEWDERVLKLGSRHNHAELCAWAVSAGAPEWHSDSEDEDDEEEVDEEGVDDVGDEFAEDEEVDELEDTEVDDENEAEEW
jgi:hypothetical protein